MALRQALALTRQQFEVASEGAEVTLVKRIGRGLPRMIVSLRERWRDRSPLQVSDEYDVQYLLEASLRSLFEDVRPEDPSPSRAGASTRIDFVLKREEIVVEAKMTREGLGERQVADELIDDIERYRATPTTAPWSPSSMTPSGGSGTQPACSTTFARICRDAGSDRGLQRRQGGYAANCRLGSGSCQMANAPGRLPFAAARAGDLGRFFLE